MGCLVRFGCLGIIVIAVLIGVFFLSPDARYLVFKAIAATAADARGGPTGGLSYAPPSVPARVTSKSRISPSTASASSAARGPCSGSWPSCSRRARSE